MLYMMVRLEGALMGPVQGLRVHARDAHLCSLKTRRRAKSAFDRCSAVQAFAGEAVRPAA